MPSHNVDARALARIIEMGQYQSDDIQIVVRENSGVGAYGLGDYVTNAPECTHMEYLTEAIQLCRGEFVRRVTDDDFLYPRAVPAVLDSARRFASDGTFSGITGSYDIEQSDGSFGFQYHGLNVDNPTDRVRGYLSGGPNVILYSAVRRTILSASIDKWLHRHPLKPSYVDQCVVLDWLLAGKFADIGRRLFCYDNGNWETVAKAAQRDSEIGRQSGCPDTFLALHWLACAFEGAVTATRAGNHEVARAWYDTMMARFSSDTRHLADDKATSIARWALETYPNMRLEGLLDDLCGTMSGDQAKAYRDFWSET